MDVKHAVKDIEIAFLQLEFAIKLLSYCESENIEPQKFDTDHVVAHENLYLPTGKFSHLEDIKRAAGISVLVALGASAIVLYEALDSAGFNVNPESDDEQEKLCALAYMVRCAYAHGMSEPKWHARGRNICIHKVNLPSGILELDLNALNGEVLEYGHLGQLETWFEIRDVSIQMIENTLHDQ